MSVMQYYAQRGEYEEEQRRLYEAAKKDGWEGEYEEYLDSLDEEPADQYNVESEDEVC